MKARKRFRVVLLGSIFIFFFVSTNSNAQSFKLYQEGRIDEAIQAYKKALKLNPEDGYIYLMLGVLYEDKKTVEKAAYYFKASESLYPKKIDFYNSRGMVYFQGGKLDKAAADVKEALKIDPKNPLSHFLLGNIYEAEDRFAEAITQYEIVSNTKNGPAQLVVMARFKMGMMKQEDITAKKNFNISIVDVRVTGIGLTGANLEIVFNIRNPNGIAATLDQLDYKIYGNNIYLGEGKINNAINVPAHSNRIVSSSFVLNYSSVDKIGRDDLAKGAINWKISIDLGPGLTEEDRTEDITVKAKEEETKLIKLYFSDSQGKHLVPEEREVLAFPQIDQQAKEILKELINGPLDNSLKPTVPPQTEVRDVYVKDDGFYVDFSSSLKEKHPGGSSGELLTIYSIVNTLLINFPSQSRVRILIQGEPAETIAGHFNIRGPLSKRLDIVKAILGVVPKKIIEDKVETIESSGNDPWSQATSLDYPVPKALYLSNIGVDYKHGYEFWHPVSGYGHHLGEDIKLPEGMPVEAIGNGKIAYYGAATSYGELVVAIEHDLGKEYEFTNGLEEIVSTQKIISIYGHLRKSEERGGSFLRWKVGDYVRKGEIIGYVNDAEHNGVPTKEHLHMAIRLSDKSAAWRRDGKYWLRGYDRDKKTKCGPKCGEDFAALSGVIEKLVEAKLPPVLTSPLKISPSPPYYAGDRINAEFTITNKGTAPITFNILTAGGRDPDNRVADFTFRRDIKLSPNKSYNYKGSLTLAKAGNYHFFCAYQTADGKWNPSVDLGRGLTDEDRTEAITAKVEEEEPPKKQITKVSKMVGKLSTYQDEKQNLMFLIVPLVMYEGGNYRSVYVESWKECSEKIRQDLENIKKLWLYHEGNLIGIFEVSGFEENAGSYQEGVLTGKVYWEPKITTDIHNVVALSRPIPQPFWSKELNSEQISSLNQILNETLMRASTLLTEELKQHGIHYEDSQRTIGTAPKGRSTIIFDLEQDDQPEVYASVHWKGEPCAEMYASILATWKDNNWIVLRRSTSIAECPGIGEAAGERRFEIEVVVDIDGDGVAELIMSEGAWENYEYILYQVHKGRLIRILDIGNYGL